MRRLDLCPCPFWKVLGADDVVPRHHQGEKKWVPGSQVYHSFPLQAQKAALVILCCVLDTLETYVHQKALEQP